MKNAETQISAFSFYIRLPHGRYFFVKQALRRYLAVSRAAIPRIDHRIILFPLYYKIKKDTRKQKEGFSSSAFMYLQISTY